MKNKEMNSIDTTAVDSQTIEVFETPDDVLQHNPEGFVSKDVFKNTKSVRLSKSGNVFQKDPDGKFYTILDNNVGTYVVGDALYRFIDAQEGKLPGCSSLEIANKEIAAGHKDTHWIWYVLPQMKGLGYSGRSKYFGISDREEAKNYINHPILGPRLIETCTILFNSPKDIYTIFGNDAIKVRSCIKLFSTVSDHPIFKKILTKYHWN